ncbi:MAG: MBL fold metallo-hydrolase [Rhodospirillaceae bacterium]|nr:MBL fold metallo-hydrolase [Rhodospirillaceae bacterium]|tara:strand:- start:21 stop:707 length:687 start_codon:yes stop_codon:yes gene_type:complete
MALDYEIIVKGNNLRIEDGFLGLANLTLVESDDGPLLFDTGHFCNRPMLLKALARRGYGPGDVRKVFLSHLHFDHCVNVDLFPKAKIYVSRRELEYADSPHPDDIFVPWLIREQLSRHDVTYLEGEGELGAGIRYMPAPGHTPGQYMLVLDHPQKGCVVLAGDAIKYAKEAVARCSDMPFLSVEEGERTINKILGMADRIVPGHFPELIKRDGRFIWEDQAPFPLFIR